MNRNVAGRRSAAGYTLADAAVVCFLVMALAGAALDVAWGVAARLRLASACGAFVGAVERARGLAVARNGSYEVRIRPDGLAFAVAPVGLDGDKALWRNLPRGVFFSRAPRRSVTFHSRGSAAPSGSFHLASAAGEMKVVVAVSGRIRWQALQPRTSVGSSAFDRSPGWSVAAEQPPPDRKGGV